MARPTCRLDSVACLTAASAGRRAGMAVALVPVPQAGQDEHAAQRRKREPSEAVLSTGKDEERGDERTQRRAEIAADLKQRLRQSMRTRRTPAGRCAMIRMEDGRAEPQHHPPGQQYGVARRKSQRDEPDQRRTHAERQRVGLRLTVGVETDEGLQQRGRDLVGQRQQADLREAEIKPAFEDG